jgi:hypothetical protein
MMIEKRIIGDSPKTFVRGPAVIPADKLVVWLDRQQADGKPRLVRLPVVLKRQAVGFSIHGARVGVGPDALEIYCNDAALGIGLADRARSPCTEEPQCAMWLEGYWRGKKDGDYTFDVVRVHAPIAPADLAAADYAEVEAVP